MGGASLALSIPVASVGVCCQAAANCNQKDSMSDTAPSWETLLLAANGGDGRALGRFLLAVTPVVRRIITVRGHALPPDQHEDIVQEVLFAIHLKRHSWQPDTPVRPWLYAVTRYKVVDAFRRRGSFVHLPIEDFAEVLEGDAGPEGLPARDADALLAQIDPRAADIVRAIGLQGDSTGAVGARFSMTEGAVRVAYHRAIKRLAAIGRGPQP